MSAYWALITTRFRTLLQYRGAAVGGLFTQIAFGLMRIMILEAFYQASVGTRPMRFEQVVAYVWLGQATIRLVPWNVDTDVRDMVRSGTLGYELCRPLDLYAVWYSRALAWRLAPMLIRLVPMFVLAMVLLPLLGLPEWRLPPPPSLAAGAMWIAAILGALLLSCALTALMNISLLWTISGQGVPVLVSAMASMFGGLILPLPLFPGWAQPILMAMPFAGILDLPSRVFTGHIPVGEAVWVLGHQLGWTLALVLMGRAALSRGTRRIVIQGG